MKRIHSRMHFTADNRQRLLLLLLLLAGVGGGVAVYASFGEELPERMRALLSLQPIPATFRDAVWQLLSDCFQMLVLLLVLFVSGLSACGIPVVVLVPLFWGVGLGLSLAYYYTDGLNGVLLCAVLLLPPTVPKAAVLLMACKQSLHMSAQMLGRLFPRGARCGGLWQTFRTYCGRFFLLLPIVLLAGVLDVGLRALLLRFFPAFIG